MKVKNLLSSFRAPKLFHHQLKEKKLDDVAPSALQVPDDSLQRFTLLKKVFVNQNEAFFITDKLACSSFLCHLLQLFLPALVKGMQAITTLRTG